MATFAVLQGPDKGRTLKTDGEIVLVGRASEDMPITDQTVSRRHAQLKRQAGNWVLHDLGSANGTYLNGVRLQRPTRLKHGDQIRVGSTLLMYAGDESIEQFSGASIPNDLVRLDAASAEMGASIVASVPSSEDSVVMAAPETASAVKAWRVIRELSDVIGSLLPPEQLLTRVMDIIFSEVDVDRGVIFIRDEATADLLPEVVRFRQIKGAGTPDKSIMASRTIMNHVVAARGGVLCSNVVNDSRFMSGKSVQNMGMRSVICAPIVARENVLGIIHLDCPVTQHTYGENELRLITAIGYQTGLAIENARLVQAQMQQERLAATGETVAYLSHSIKNMLQGTRSGGDMLRRGLAKRELPQVAQGWGIVDRNLDKIYSLMMNMLAFSKEREPRLEMIQLNRIVEDSVSEMQNAADAKSVVLLSDLDENLPPVPLDFDGAQQVALNLVSNAIDAVAPNDGIVNVRTFYDSAKREIVFSVADNGPGIPPEEREKIFQPFHSTKGHGGTGLGLAVVRKSVKEMGGRIRLNTPADGGAEFVVRFEVSPSRAPESGDTHGPGSRSGSR